MHYFVPAMFGPILVVGIIFLLRKKMTSFYAIKAFLIIAVVNLVSCSAGNKIWNECQLILFGEVDTDPGDVGVFFFTLPIFLFFFVGSVASVIGIRYLSRIKIEQE